MKTLLLLAAAAAQMAAAPVTLKVKVQPAGAVVEMPLETYVAAVLAGEGSVLRSEEARKAMAVAARTFAIYSRGRHASEGYDLCGTTHCQRLDMAAVTPRLEAAAAATAGELLWFAGKPAFTVYSQDCGGMTEDAGAVWAGTDVSYLKRRVDPYCTRPGAPEWHWSTNPVEVLKALAASQLRGPRVLEQIVIARRTASGRAELLALRGGGESVEISAGAFRFAVGRALGWNTIRSERYEVAGLSFRGSGAGHGVGLCQRGADQMGATGRPYREILGFYYPGTLVGLTGRGLAWTRMGGQGVVLASTQPESDRAVLAAAERALREARDRTRMAAPGEIEIRQYPDVETFRNATGEPGWVAAHTVGRRIDLQPAQVLRERGGLESTLRHEMLHVLVEAHGRGDLPVWFREGLVGYLEGAASSSGVTPRDSDLRQTSDEGRARQAYAAAAGTVADLVKRYGEGTVLGWLTAGLPREVRNANTSPAATKSK